MKFRFNFLFLFLIICVFVGCPNDDTNNTNNNGKITDLQSIINSANPGSTINLSNYQISNYKATINKTLTINGGNKNFGGANVGVESNGVVINNINGANVTAGSSLGNGSLKIANSSLSSLKICGGGINSIHVENVNVTNVILDKSVNNDNDEFVRLAVEGKINTLKNIAVKKNAIIDGKEYSCDKNTLDAGVQLALSDSTKAKSDESDDDYVVVNFGKKTADYEKKFAIKLAKTSTLDNRFLKDVALKLWNEDFYGFSWVNLSEQTQKINNNLLVTKPITELIDENVLILDNENKVSLVCNAKEKWFLIPDVFPRSSDILDEVTNDCHYNYSKLHVTKYSYLEDSSKYNKDLVIRISNEQSSCYSSLFDQVCDEQRNIYYTNGGYYGSYYTPFTQLRMIKEETIDQKYKNNELGYENELVCGDGDTDNIGPNYRIEDFGIQTYKLMRVAIYEDDNNKYLYLLSVDGDEKWNLSRYDLNGTFEKQAGFANDVYLPKVKMNIDFFNEASQIQAFAVDQETNQIYIAYFGYDEQYGLNGVVCRKSMPSQCQVVRYAIEGTTCTKIDSRSYKQLGVHIDALDETLEVNNYGDRGLALNYSSNDGAYYFGISDMEYANNRLYIVEQDKVTLIPDSNRDWKEGEKMRSRGSSIIYDWKNNIAQSYGWTESSNAVKCPSPADENKAFFGCNRFLAVEPKKLIILDDGTACYYDENDPSCEIKTCVNYYTSVEYWTYHGPVQKNRVAKFDLNEKILSFIEAKDLEREDHTIGLLDYCGFYQKYSGSGSN